MDLWDVVRLMLRRWMIAVPMLILTVAGTAWVGMTVKPDYTAEGSISLLPPSVEEALAAGKSRTVNPWDTNSLTGAVAVRLRSKALHDSLVTDGYSGVFEADKDLQFPSVVIIKVTAPTAEQAAATAKRLLQIITEEVQRQQAGYRLQPGEEITTTVIDDGSSVQTATGKVKRALIVVVGIGGILTMIVTVSVDAALRWRARRRAGAGERLVAPPAKLTSLVKAANGTPAEAVRPPGVPVRSGSAAMPASPAQGDGASATTQPVQLNPEYPVAGTSPDDTQIIPSRSEPASDATIILPLSNAPWGDKKARSADGIGTEVRKR